MKPRSILQAFTSPVFLASGMLLFTAAMPNLSLAQGLYGSLSGTVSDPSGAAVPSIEVKVTEKKSGAVTVGKTNESGNFLIQNLEPGTYSVQITGTGFATATQDNIEVVQNSIRRDDVSLKVGNVSESVVVQAENTMLQTDRADVNETVDAKQIENLPLSTTRNFQNLEALIPGFTAPFSSHSSAGNPAGSTQYNANGISYSVNSTTLDGASDVYQWIPDLALYIPPAESIQSFNVVTANYTADQGSVGGAVTTIITKSGGNQFHGALWEYHVNNALNAKPYFYTAAKLPKLISNQFGAEVGGPILHNKLFFFADWERTSQRTGSSAFYTLPTAALIAGNFAGTGTTIYDPQTGNAAGQGRTPFLNNAIPSGRLSPAALKLLSYVPTVSVPTGGSVVNDFLFAPSIPSTQDNVDGKVTFNPTDRTTFFAKYSISRKNVLDPQPFGQAGGGTTDGGLAGNATGDTQLATLGATHTFTSNFVADGTFGYTRQNIGNLGTDLGSNFGTDVLGIPGTNGPNYLQGGVPAFNLSGFSSYGNGSSNAPFSFRDNQYALAGTAHWTMRNHTISFGANLLYINMNHFQTTGASFPARGGFSFTGGNTALNGSSAPNLYNSFADFLLGAANSMGTGAQYTPFVRLDEWEYAAYVQDQWQATRSTTVNYGIRYELYPYEHNPAFGGDVYNPDNNTVLIGGYGGVPFNPGVNTGHGIWLPRVGIAQRLSNKTVIRGGVALSVNPSNFKYAMTTYPFVLQVTYNAPNSFSAAGNLATGIPASPPLPDITTGSIPVPTNFGISSYPRDFDRGHIASYNLDFEQQLLPWMAASVAYVGNNATHQNCIRNINAGEPGLGAAGQPFNQKFGTTTARNLYDPICPSNYNGLHAQLKVNGGGFSGSGIAYAYAKAMDWTEHEDGLLSYSSDDVLGRNYGLNANDIKHNLHIYTVYQLPFGRGQRWATHGLTSAVFGGWSFTNILTMRSGTPFTVTSSGASLNSPGNTQTANQVASHVAIYGAHAPLDGSSVNVVTNPSWQASRGPYTSVEVHGEETFDARLDQPGWDTAHFVDSKWVSAADSSAVSGTMVSQNAPPVTAQQTFMPTNITNPAENVYVYDFGQNMNGVYQITVQGRAGAVVTMLPGEALSDARVAPSNSHGSTYILKGGRPETWRLNFSTIGFRYLEVRGVTRSTAASDLPRISDAKAFFTYTASKATGLFEASDDRYNKIHKLALNTVRSGLVSIHQDGPNYEKLGWQEVAWTMFPSAIYELDLQRLYTKITRDIRDNQRPSGMVATLVPNWFRDSSHTANEGPFQESPAWGSSIFAMPWSLYWSYGDRHILEENYDAMKGYLSFMKGKEKNGLIAYGLGDWMAPGGTSVPNVEGAVYVLDTKITRDVAKVLGQDSDAEYYASEYARVSNNYNKAYFDDPAGLYQPVSEANEALPLVFGIVPSGKEEAVREALMEDITHPVEIKGTNSYGKPGEFGPVLPFHVTTGDIGTTFLWRALGDAGDADLVQKMIMQPSGPSYMDMIERGETTIDENWNVEKTRSHNHDMYGGILEWFYSTLGGISALQPGYEIVQLKPQMPDGLKGVITSYDSVRGKIGSSWSVLNGITTWTVEVPANTSAELSIPLKSTALADVTIQEGSTIVYQNGQPARSVPGVLFEKTEQTSASNAVLWKLGSGRYRFTWAARSTK